MTESELIERAATAIDAYFGDEYADALTMTTEQARAEVNEWLISERDGSPIDAWEFERAWLSYRKDVESWVNQ